MAARSAADIRNQIGYETTPGTSVPATRRLRNVSFMFQPKQEIETVRAMGFRTTTSVIKHREMTMGPFEGMLSATELIPILASRFGTTGGTQIGTTDAYRWRFEPAIGAPGDTPKTLTIEKGDATNSQRISYAVVNSLKFDINNVNAGKFSGDLIARAPQNQSAVTASGVTFYPVANIAASSYDLWLADSYADVLDENSGDRLRDVIDSISIDIGEQYVAFQPFESDFPDFKELTQKNYEVKIDLTLNNSAAARAVRDAVKFNPLPTKFLRLRARGSEIDTGIFNQFSANFAVHYMMDEDVDNVQDVFGIKLGFQCIVDPVSGLFHDYELINTVTAF
jgi:hypothetical protein